VCVGQGQIFTQTHGSNIRALHRSDSTHLHFVVVLLDEGAQRDAEAVPHVLALVPRHGVDTLHGCQGSGGRSASQEGCRVFACLLA
jgi:hypothetical protein